MGINILVVDDQPDLVELLQMNLEAAGFSVTTALSGAEAVSSIAASKPDLILLDVVLEDVSGVELAGKLKNQPGTSGIPIILLTARDSDTDVIVGLSVGADDYVTKPFSSAVLIARIENVLRRLKKIETSTKNVLSIGPVRIDLAARSVKVEGKLVDLTGSEFDILSSLMIAAGAILSREDLLNAIGERAGESTRIVDVHVAALRKKLGTARKIVKTIHGRGYRIQN
jgi:DNA-binding response OmpR family regulator